MPRALRTASFSFVLLVCTALAVACGPSSTPSAGTTTPAPAIGTPPQFSVQQTATTSTSGGTTLPALGSNGYSVSAVLPTANVVAHLTETATSRSPGGLPVVDVGRVALDRRERALGTIFPILWLTVSADVPVTFTGTFSVSFVLPAITPGFAYYLANYNVQTAAWNLTFAGPGTIAGNTIAFTAAGTLTISNAVTATFALYAVDATQTPSPSSAPSNSPSATPSGAATATPTATASGAPTAAPTAQPSPGVGVGSSPLPLPSPTTTSVGVPTSSPLPLPSPTTTGVVGHLPSLLQPRRIS